MGRAATATPPYRPNARVAYAGRQFLVTLCVLADHPQVRLQIGTR